MQRVGAARDPSLAVFHTCRRRGGTERGRSPPEDRCVTPTVTSGDQREEPGRGCCFAALEAPPEARHQQQREPQRRSPPPPPPTTPRRRHSVKRDFSPPGPGRNAQLSSTNKKRRKWRVGRERGGVMMAILACSFTPPRDDRRRAVAVWCGMRKGYCVLIVTPRIYS